MRRNMALLATGLFFVTLAGCGSGDEGVGPPPPKTTIEPDGESFKWEDQDTLADTGSPSEGQMNSRFVNRKIDRLRACTTNPECTTGSADERECTTAVLTREDEGGRKIEVTMGVVECAGSSGNLCIEWHLTGYDDALTGRLAGSSRELPEEFFAVGTDLSWELTCDTIPVQYVEIDWKGSA